MTIIKNNSIVVQQVVKENRKLIIEHLADVLTVADHVFEQGYFSRADYHEIEDLEGALNRCNKFLDILISKYVQSVPKPELI
jgi:hypothetical protein